MIVFSWVVIAVAAAITAVLALPALSETVSAIVALTRLRRARQPGQPPRARLLIIVPAHNEQGLIGSCVKSLVAGSRQHADVRVVVLADNCTDATTAVARDAGAEVLERHDKTLIGKSHALNWAFGKLPLEEYDALVIVDADTTAVPQFADALAAHGPLSGKVLQAYFGTSNPDDSWLARLGALLSLLRYEYSYPLKTRAGLNSPMTGNGMCLGRNVLKSIRWPAEALTENWDLYAMISAAGFPITYVREARMLSEEAPTMSGASTQRRRWLAGRFMALRSFGSAILTSRKIGWRQKLDCLAELTALGPVLQTTVALLVVAGLLALPGSTGEWLAWTAAATIAPTMLLTLVAWLRAPDRVKLFFAFLRLPVYAVWRVAVAGLALRTGAKGVWERSPRSASDG